MTGTRRERHDDSGVGLIDTLVATAILGIGATAVIGAMMTSISVATDGQRSAVAQAALRAYAEAVTGATYVDCAVPASYAGSGFTPPAGYTASLAVAYWAPAGTTGTFGATCATDSGVQRVALTLTSDGTTTTLPVVKRRIS